MSNREVVFSSQFKRDLKKHFMALATIQWAEVLNGLVKDELLPEKYHDHALINDWKDCRDCHIKPDLILIYRKKNEDILELVRLGTHAELFG